ncbi:hypothetical protein HY404_03195 [Candidatus Microgenomates bacterium]|nr:hypothetical protein [Candidatus Microgenomates bacterium]
MMKKIIIILVVIALVGVAAKMIINPPPDTGSNIILAVKENSEGPVTVTVAPHGWENGVNTWDFDITLDTHSEELNTDLVAMSLLMDDQGKVFKPLSWEGDPPGGHHRRGILKFKTISPRPKSIELKIKNVGGVTERSFRWTF